MFGLLLLKNVQYSSFSNPSGENKIPPLVSSGVHIFLLTSHSRVSNKRTVPLRSQPVEMNLTQICLELLAKMNLNINLSNLFWIDYRTMNETGYFAILVQL